MKTRITLACFFFLALLGACTTNISDDLEPVSSSKNETLEDNVKLIKELSFENSIDNQAKISTLSTTIEERSLVNQFSSLRGEEYREFFDRLAQTEAYARIHKVSQLTQSKMKTVSARISTSDIPLDQINISDYYSDFNDILTKSTNISENVKNHYNIINKQLSELVESNITNLSDEAQTIAALTPSVLVQTMSDKILEYKKVVLDDSNLTKIEQANLLNILSTMSISLLSDKSFYSTFDNQIKAKMVTKGARVAGWFSSIVRIVAIVAIAVAVSVITAGVATAIMAATIPATTTLLASATVSTLLVAGTIDITIGTVIGSIVGSYVAGFTYCEMNSQCPECGGPLLNTFKYCSPFDRD